MTDALAWTAAIGSILTALATSGLVAVAWFALGGTRDQVKLIQEDSRRRTRPYVYLQIEPGLHGPGHWDLVVKNTGRTSASDVVINVGVLTSEGDDDYITDGLVAYLAEAKIPAP